MTSHSNNNSKPVLIQVFASFSPSPTVPLLVRAPLTTQLRNILHIALLKILDMHPLSGSAGPVATLPHLYEEGFLMYPAHGDGTRNTSPVSRDGPLHKSCTLEDYEDVLSFPYMIHVSAAKPSMVEGKKSEPLPEHVLVAYGLPPTSAPRPLQSNVLGVRNELMQQIGLTENDIVRYGPMAEFKHDSSRDVEKHRAMLTRRRDDVVTKKMFERAKVEEKRVMDAIARDESLRQQLQHDNEKRRQQDEVERSDPLHAGRVKHMAEMTRLRHKLESDVSKGRDLFNVVEKQQPQQQQQQPSTANHNTVLKHASMSSSSSTIHIASPPPPGPKTPAPRPKQQVLDGIIQSLDASILQEYLDAQEAYKRDRAQRAKKAVMSQQTQSKAIIQTSQQKKVAQVEQEMKQTMQTLQERSRSLYQEHEAKREEAKLEEAKKFLEWKAERSHQQQRVYSQYQLSYLR
eukprot:PhF_6_TR34931/c1_g1_i1/m.50623